MCSIGGGLGVLVLPRDGGFWSCTAAASKLTVPTEGAAPGRRNIVPHRHILVLVLSLVPLDVSDIPHWLHMCVVGMLWRSVFVRNNLSIFLVFSHYPLTVDVARFLFVLAKVPGLIDLPLVRSVRKWLLLMVCVWLPPLVYLVAFVWAVEAMVFAE